VDLGGKYAEGFKMVCVWDFGVCVSHGIISTDACYRTSLYMMQRLG
jgi:hypothetical protein